MRKLFMFFKRTMEFLMSRFIRKIHKVIKLVVIFNFINMMNSFCRSKIPTNMLFHYKAVFKNAFVFLSKRMVRRIDFYISICSFTLTTIPLVMFLSFTRKTHFQFSCLGMFVTNMGKTKFFANFFRPFFTFIPSRFSFTVVTHFFKSFYRIAIRQIFIPRNRAFFTMPITFVRTKLGRLFSISCNQKFTFANSTNFLNHIKTPCLTTILALVLMSCQVNNGYCVDEFDKLEPLGTRSVSDIDAYLNVNFEAQDRLMYNYRRGLVAVASSSSQVQVLPGEIAIPNSGGSVVRYRKNTSTVTVNWDDLDSGSESASQYYYIYACGDSASTAATFKISTSSTAPTGITYYKKIAYLYNNSDSNIVNVSNIKNSDAPNIVSVTGSTDITTTSSSYEDMTDMEIRFVSSGRPVKSLFQAPFYGEGQNVFSLDIDGTNKVSSTIDGDTGTSSSGSLVWVETLSAGTHTIKIEWKKGGTVTAQQRGSTDGKRVLIAEEL